MVAMGSVVAMVATEYPPEPVVDAVPLAEGGTSRGQARRKVVKGLVEPFPGAVQR